MTSTKMFSSASSWTHKIDSERLQEHDFSNLVQECRYAVARQDSLMMAYCERELWQMYRERKQFNGQR